MRIEWSDQLEIGMPLLECAGRFPASAKVIPWIPGMRTNIADAYLMTWHSGDLRRYYEAGGKKEKLIVHFLSYDTGVIAPLWGDSFHKRVDRMKEFKCKTIVSPDFSSWADMPLPLQIFNYYKSNVVTRDLLKAGFEVIPNLCWSHPKLIEFSVSQWGAHTDALIDVNHDWFTGDSVWADVFLKGLRYYHDLHPTTRLAVYCNTPDALAAVKRIHPSAFWVATRAKALMQLQRVGKRIAKAKQAKAESTGD